MAEKDYSHFFSFISIKRDDFNLIMRRQMHNMLARVSGKGNFNYQIYRLQNATYNSHRTIG